MTEDNNYCASSFLMYRRVVDSNKCFKNSQKPNTVPLNWDKVNIHSSTELENHLRQRVLEATKDGKAALALSGGIDSAILAKFMPEGSTAYTFKCTAGDVKVTDETGRAATYAKACGLKHKIVEISWEDMEQLSPKLMNHKHSPMHSIEVQIYKAGLQAKTDGFERIIYGESADVNYGGLSNILSKDWLMGDFIERYTYLKPWLVLKDPKIDLSPFVDYEKDGYIDTHKYLREFDIIESINSYTNACQLAGIDFVAPYADTTLAEDLDLKRIRSGQNKYLIREIFERLYQGFEAPAKIPMPRATDEWLKDWQGPTRPEFYPNCAKNLTGDQKWLLWSLEKFLNMTEAK